MIKARYFVDLIEFPANPLTQASANIRGSTPSVGHPSTAPVGDTLPMVIPAGRLQRGPYCRRNRKDPTLSPLWIAIDRPGFSGRPEKDTSYAAADCLSIHFGFRDEQIR